MSQQINQNQRVLNHLIDHGYITQSVASNYGIRRLASRINDLKNEAVNIVRVMRRDDAGVPYAFYALSPADRAFETARRASGFAYKRGAAPRSLAA
jgi:hypothetical protein